MKQLAGLDAESSELRALWSLRGPPKVAGSGAPERLSKLLKESGLDVNGKLMKETRSKL